MIIYLQVSFALFVLKKYDSLVIETFTWLKNISKLFEKKYITNVY